jgi:hypothetical protein
MRKGFKSEAREMAAEVRTEIGLGPLDPLDPFVLAGHLAVPVLPLSALDGCSEAAHHFSTVEPECFSAVTVFHGPRRTIVHNDAHAPVRQNSNIAHELAHCLLQHRPAPAFNDAGCRHWDQDVEDEAAYLGAALLVTAEAALSVVRHRTSLAVASHRYGVSDQLMTWMINDCGARKRVQRERMRRSRSGTS